MIMSSGNSGCWNILPALELNIRWRYIAGNMWIDFRWVCCDARKIDSAWGEGGGQHPRKQCQRAAVIEVRLRHDPQGGGGPPTPPLS